MGRALRLVVAGIAALAGAMAGGPASAQEPGGPAYAADSVLARVNEWPITVRLFNRSYAEFLSGTGANDTEANRRLHLNTLVDAYLLADEARRRGLEDAGYRAFVQTELKKAVGGRYFEVALLDTLPLPTDAEIRNAFRKSRTQVAVRHLVVPTLEEAEALYARLEAGERFDDLARRLYGAADTSAAAPAWIGYWEMDDAFSEAAFALPVGAYGRPVRSRHGYHILFVTDRRSEPLLTEIEYRNGRAGVESRLVARRRRLEGDRFVQALMESLAVRIDAEALRRVEEAVGRVFAKALVPAGAGEPLQEPEIDPVALQEVRPVFGPETVLLTYTLDGTPRRFTAADYYAWLTDVPASEARHRTAASVGRALRNEVLAERGFARGLAEDALVEEHVAHRAHLFLADRLRRDLRAHPEVHPTEADLREGYERLGFRKRTAVNGDFWMIPFDTFEAARTALDDVRADPDRAAARPGFRRFTGEDLSAWHGLAAHLVGAPLGEPVSVLTADEKAYLVLVSRRETVYAAFEDVRADVEALLARHLGEVRLLERLRREADLRVNTPFFTPLLRR